MKHDDGIEVYLQPDREGGDVLRFPELIIPDHDPNRKRCCVPVLEKSARIIFKFSKDFNAYRGNCVRLSVTYNGVGSKSHSWETMLKKSRVAGQQCWGAYRVFGRPAKWVPLPLVANKSETPNLPLQKLR